MATYEYAARSTIGARDNQEDSMAVWPVSELSESGRTIPAGPRLLALLADGMGGHAAGALASQMVCEHFLSAFGVGDADSHRDVRERLRLALFAANDAIADKVVERPQLDGMGSTVIGASFGDDGLDWISVGDSPMYLVRRGEIAVLNEDHSLAPALDALADAGKITREKALADPRRHMLRSAVTGEEFDLIDVSKKSLELVAGDLVILSSDGIHTLGLDEIARIATAYADDGPAAVAASLIRAVEAAGEVHQDNTSVLVVRPVV